MIGLITLSVTIILAGYFTPSQQKDALKISVYYETYCPDSIQFLMYQLVPMMGEFNQYPDWLTLDLLPFGKAKKTGEHQYTCQHGTKECDADKLEACAIYELVTQQITPLYMRLANFIYCTLLEVDQVKAARKCAAQTGVDYKQLMNCYKGQQGDILMDMYANRTAALQPPLTYVPTIVLNDIYNKSVSEEAERDLYGLVCKYVPDQC